MRSCHGNLDRAGGPYVKENKPRTGQHAPRDLSQKWSLNKGDIIAAVESKSYRRLRVVVNQEELANWGKTA